MSSAASIRQFATANSDELGVQVVPSLNLVYTEEEGYVTADIAESKSLVSFVSGKIEKIEVSCLFFPDTSLCCFLIPSPVFSGFFSFWKLFEYRFGLNVPISISCPAFRDSVWLIDACSQTKKSLSGTKFRKMLRGGEDIPEWFAFKSVVKVLREANK